MALLVLSFIAGVLTVAAPCILPLLPVIVGGSVVNGPRDSAERQWLRPIIIVTSLAFSVVTFTLLIKATTALLGVPQLVWQIISGSIVALLGLNYLWPHAWERLAAQSYIRSNSLLTRGYQRGGVGGDIVMGAALGPVFSSCSPTYALIVATVLPVSFVQGLVYLVAYAVGMSGTLLMIAYLGQVFVARLKWLSDPAGWFKKAIGMLFIAVGISVIFGIDKKFQAFVLEKGWYDPISNVEEALSD